jgi:hypothetical protein
LREPPISASRSRAVSARLRRLSSRAVQAVDRAEPLAARFSRRAASRRIPTYDYDPDADRAASAATSAAPVTLRRAAPRRDVEAPCPGARQGDVPMMSIPRSLRVATVVLAVGAHVAAQRPCFERLYEPLPSSGILPARPLTVADFDGDGAPDVLTVFGVLLNDGAGRFALGPATAAFSDAMRARAADFDGDGDLDVAAQRGAAGTSIYLNNGSGTFAIVAAPYFDGATFVALPALSDFELATADFDGDGMTDLLVRNVAPSGNVDCKVLRATGGGTFADGTPLFGAPPVVGYGDAVLDAFDADGDGATDVLVNRNGILSATETTAGAFSPPTPLAVMAFASVPAYVRGDFDGDGARDDVAIAGAPLGSGASTVLGPFVLLHGPSGFVGATPPVAPWDQPVALAAADVDGDGKEELLALSSAASALYAVVGGAPAYPPLGAASVVGGASVPAAAVESAYSADLDGDGDRDVLAATLATTWRPLFAGAGALRDPSHADVPALLPGFGSLVANLNGDAYPDVLQVGSVVAPNAAPTFAFGAAMADGRGGWTTGATAPPRNPIGATAAVVADFDGDGFDDVLLARHESAAAGGVLVRLSDGAGGGTVVPVPIVPAATPAFAFVAATALDVDADGDPDVALLHSNAVDLLTNVGGGAFVRQVVGAMSGPRALAAGDLDADGDDDLLVVGFATASVYWNQGGVLVPAVLSPTIGGDGAAVGDLDADGDLDLMVGRTPFLNVAGAFTPAAPVAAAAGASPFGYFGAQIADCDLDGVADVVFAGLFARGLGGGAFAPGERIGPFGSSIDQIGSFQTADRPYGVHDFDRDGDPDLLDSAGNLFVNTTRHLARGSLARPGRVASMRLYGAPFSAVDLVAASALRPAAVALPVWGDLHLDPATVLFALPVALDAAGLAEVGGPVPNVPALVGTTLHWQAVHVGDARLSRVVTTVVEGF